MTIDLEGEKGKKKKVNLRVRCGQLRNIRKKKN
jgi:hypothetical protein